MKRKSLFLLGSILAGACLVGGTFAAYAVTDNANPFGIKITPSSGGSSETTDTVTLEWGDKTQFTDITDLKKGDVILKTVEVKATTSDSKAYKGTLSLRLTDQTVIPDPVEHLINYLGVEVWDNAKDAAGAQRITYIPTAAESFETSVLVEVTSGAAKKLYFYVSLDEEMEVSAYQKVKEDLVYLEIDWSKNPSDTEATNVYVSSTSTPKAYVWNSTTGNFPVEFPGAEMTAVSGITNLYSYLVPTSYDRIIFTTNVGQTADLIIDSNVRTTTPYWNGTAWATKPTSSNAEYYLIGSINQWKNGLADFKFTPNTAQPGEYMLQNVAFAANSEFKVITKDGSTFYGQYSSGTSEGTDVFSIGDAGLYDIYFVPAGTTKWSGQDQTIKFIYCTNSAA